MYARRRRGRSPDASHPWRSPRPLLQRGFWAADSAPAAGGRRAAGRRLGREGAGGAVVVRALANRRGADARVRGSGAPRPPRGGARLWIGATEHHRRTGGRHRARHGRIDRRGCARDAQRTRERVHLETATVDWTERDELVAGAPFDLVLAADVVYERVSVGALFSLLPRLGPDGRAADPGPARRRGVPRAGEAPLAGRHAASGASSESAGFSSADAVDAYLPWTAIWRISSSGSRAGTSPRSR
jgi:hypothetical protein